MVELIGVKALTFDCYGTLIDWETGILEVLRGWTERRGIAVSDEELLRAFAREESEAERVMAGVPYRDILRAVMNQIAHDYGADAYPEDADALATSVGDWPPFPDSTQALGILKSSFKLAIISNVDRASFARTQEKLGVEFDAVITAEDAGAYKPDHRPFLLALSVMEEMGIGRHEILHVAQSLFHDHVPARDLGLRTVWVDRRRGKPGWGATPPPDVEVEPDLVVASLAELARLAASASF